MGKVHFKFTKKDVESAPSKVINGRTVYKLSYKVEVDLFSDRGDVEVRAIVNGTQRGKGSIQFEQSYDMQPK
jgi:hypothetical protein